MNCQRANGLFQEMPGHKDHVVPRDHKAIPAVQWDHKDLKDSRATAVHMEHRAPWDPKVIPEDHKDHKDHKECKVPGD